jgi:hypothetical protein
VTLVVSSKRPNQERARTPNQELLHDKKQFSL